jgi:hypothetical protein
VRLKTLASLVLAFTFSAVPCWAGSARQYPPGVPDYPRGPGRPPTVEEQERAKLDKDMAKRANQERQVELRRDADKLLKLATELKQYVDKTNENVLSLEVLKKSEEIEKLARSVKDKMKGN